MIHFKVGDIRCQLLPLLKNGDKDLVNIRLADGEYKG